MFSTAPRLLRNIGTPSTRRLASTLPSRSAPTNPALVAAGVLAFGGGAYYVITPHNPIAVDQHPLSKEEEDKLECAKIRHWEEGHRKRKEVEDRHAAEHQAELEKLDKQKPGYLEHRKALDAARAEQKKHEAKLVTDRHNESFPGMGGKTQSWTELKRAKAIQEANDDEKMEKLKEKMVKEGKL